MQLTILMIDQLKTVLVKLNLLFMLDTSVIIIVNKDIVSKLNTSERDNDDVFLKKYVIIKKRESNNNNIYIANQLIFFYRYPHTFELLLVNQIVVYYISLFRPCFFEMIHCLFDLLLRCTRLD